ncbi:PhoH family protein [Solibacillus sp. FSL H8-0523]|uniref:PhoH family protein n=1 Tax=Solibacillus sp. FSL H8-0523 TaxID=2954511 RepID=UPI0031019B3D
MVDKYCLVDTNAFISNLDNIKGFKKVVLGSVLRELDKLKTSRNEELAYRAREAVRHIKENQNDLYFDLVDYDAEQILGEAFENTYVDNRIIACLVENPNYTLLTNDILLLLKAKAFGIETIELNEGFESYESDYKGFKEVEMTPKEFQDFHDTRIDKNEFDLLVNEYLIIKDPFTKEPYQALKYNGEYYISIKSKALKSLRLGEFKARDLYQACAIDAVLTNQFVMFRGRAGVAKTQIALAYAMQQLQAGKYSKIIVFSNAVPTYGAYYHGLVKGDLKTKLLDSSIGNILAAKMGSYDQVTAMLLTEELVILPMSDIRGFDSTGMNAIILITEGQNTSRELMKLAIQRTGIDCKLIIEGDNSTQLDDKAFEGVNNGMRAASEVFRGLDYYGEVELQTIYRSPIAERAELMTLRK